jgi:hypothetical protein
MVVLVGLGQGRFGEVGLALVVLDDDDDLASVDRHRPLGRVFEAEPETGLGLLGVGFERAGAAVDQGDSEVVGAGASRRAGDNRGRHGDFQQRMHRFSLGAAGGRADPASTGSFGRGRRARRRVSSLWGELNIARPDRQARKSGAGRQPASSFVALAPAPWGHYKAGGAGDGAVGV